MWVGVVVRWLKDDGVEWGAGVEKGGGRGEGMKGGDALTKKTQRARA